MSDSKKIKKINAEAFERHIKRHSMWNSEGVIQLFRLMLIKDQEDKEKKNV